MDVRWVMKEIYGRLDHLGTPYSPSTVEVETRFRFGFGSIADALSAGGDASGRSRHRFGTVA